MKTMIPIYINEGYPPETTYDRLNVKEDTTESGLIVRKPDNVASENRHRAKPISSPMSRYQRVHAQYLSEQKRYNRALRSMSQEKKVVDENKECERVMLEWVMKFKPDSRNLSINNIDVDLLTKQAGRDYTNLPALTNPLLVAFLKGRNPVSVVKTSGNLRFHTPKGNKLDLIVQCCASKMQTVWTPKYQTLPMAPVVPVRPAVVVFAVEESVRDDEMIDVENRNGGGNNIENGLDN